MTRRDVAAATAGALLALMAVAGLTTVRFDVVGEARAQAGQVENPRQFMLAIASAIASVAVDSEKTAMRVNDTDDALGRLAERVAALEKRLAEAEKKR